MSRRTEELFSKLDFLIPGDKVDGGPSDRPRETALAFLEVLAGKRPMDGSLLPLFAGAVELIRAELEAAMEGPRKEAFAGLEKLLDQSEADGGDGYLRARAEALWAAFFPEARHLDDDPDRQIRELRDLRTVTVTSPASDPIIDPASEIIFTSNVLLSPPAPDTPAAEAETLRDIVEGSEKVAAEKQLYWYDHPVPIGVPAANDEAVYGLRGLSEMLRYEKTRGSASPESRLKVLLSVSVTHRGLREWALPWLKAQLAAADSDVQDGLDIYAFTEDTASEVIGLLSPWLPEEVDPEDMKSTFGVDGEYGRHYSFLKAMPALLSLLTGGKEKATFKIDLDQVFPQDVLAAETGRSALEHFTSELWGAGAVDAAGRELELGMIAGALVNEKDIGAGLFTPDIPWPGELPEGEDLLFYKLRPMAVSTRAELMTRYGYDGFPDGRHQALHRIHVTGGTNGIRFDALRRYRPFTPSFVGRAEDQAYLLSVLNRDPDTPKDEPRLAYAHASGLIMRHDKEAFATEAVKAGKAGSYVGDLVRLFVFSMYANLLPGGSEGIKETVDPFTGCFITPMPATLAFLRLALHLADPEGGGEDERARLMDLAATRLEPWVGNPEAAARGLEETYHLERRCWDGFYDALDALESDLTGGTEEALAARDAFKELVESCRISD